MYTSLLQILLSTYYLIFSTLFLQTSQAQPPMVFTSANDLWKVGDEWIVDVEVYDRTPQEVIYKRLEQPFKTDIWGVVPIPDIKQDTTKIDYRYTLHIKIVEIDNYRGTPFWKMIMTPRSFYLEGVTELDYSANLILEGKYELWIRKSDKTLMKIIYKGKKAGVNPATRIYNDLSVVSGGHWRRVPYDIIPYAMDERRPNIQSEIVDNKYHSIYIDKQLKDSITTTKLYYYERFDDGNHGCIIQKWKKGANWWDSYESRSKDKIYLRAKLREK